MFIYLYRIFITNNDIISQKVIFYSSQVIICYQKECLLFINTAFKSCNLVETKVENSWETI